jgi:hypothetical protein
VNVLLAELAEPEVWESQNSSSVMPPRVLGRALNSSKMERSALMIVGLCEDLTRDDEPVEELSYFFFQSLNNRMLGVIRTRALGGATGYRLFRASFIHRVTILGILIADQSIRFSFHVAILFVVFLYSINKRV